MVHECYLYILLSFQKEEAEHFCPSLHTAAMIVSTTLLEQLRETKTNQE